MFWFVQDTCPDAQNGNKWQGSSTYLRVLEANKRLLASIRHEHDYMAHAHLAFRQVSNRCQLSICNCLTCSSVPLCRGTYRVSAWFQVMFMQSAASVTSRPAVPVFSLVLIALFFWYGRTSPNILVHRLHDSPEGQRPFHTCRLRHTLGPEECM